MPSRRRLSAYLVAGTLLALTAGSVLLVVGVTQTGTGREYVRRTLVDALAPRVRGRLHVGRISGNVFTGVVIDSVELRGPDDSLFVAVGRVRVWYDPLDLLDRRVLLRRVEIERPVVRLQQGERGEWNFRQMFRRGPDRGPRDGTGFGGYVVADSVAARDLRFVLVLPWHPADSLRGAARDSAIRTALGARRRGGPEIRRAGRFFTRTYRWAGNALAPHVRVADPDSAGRRFLISDLDLDESDPPFRWRNIRGDVRVLGDTVWAVVPHWDLPGSTGTGRAKVVWGSGLPVRYDVHVVGDSVSLADVAWVYPTLPRAGGGRMDLRIRNRRGNLRVLEYALSRMDVRTTASRLTGAMTFAVGDTVLGVTDVALRASPADFALLRTLAGRPFPYPFRGTLTGTVFGPGGPVNRFVVDSARIVYADANVPGAVSRFSGRGGLDILRPADTRFRNFALDVGQFDLRTIRFLNPDFPRLGGFVRGRVVLDSSYLDVRARDALLTHEDGAGPPSTVAGGGRVTFGSTVTRYDLALDARPLSFATLARSYPALPVRGAFAGPLRVTGATDDLGVAARLTGAAGVLAFDGRVNARGPMYAARGTYALEGLDPRALTGDARLPAGAVNAAGALDVRLSGLADLAGSVDAAIAPSTLAATRLAGGTARVRASAGRLVVDTLDVGGAVGRLVATGALGLDAANADTLRVEVRVDSLGGLRPWLASRAAVPPTPPDSAFAALPNTAAAAVAAVAEAPVPPADSLAGELRLRATLAGSLDTTRASPGLSLDAALDGRGLVYGGVGAEALAVQGRADDVRRAARLAVSARADSLRLGGATLLRASAAFDETFGGAGGRFTVAAVADSGAALSGGGRTAVAPESTTVTLDSLRLATRAGRAWTLASPARLVARPEDNALALDSLALRGADGSRLLVAGALADRGPVAGTFVAERVQLADVRAGLVAVGALPAAPARPLGGVLAASAQLGGTRAAPTLAARLDAGDVRVGDARVGRVVGSASYAERRMTAEVGVFQRDTQPGAAPEARVLDARAALPLDLALRPVAERLGTGAADTLRASVRADSLDAALVAAVFPGLADTRGRVSAVADVSGTWRRPRVGGQLRLTDGAATVAAAGVRVEDATADVGLAGDTVYVRRVAARSGGPGDTVSVTGMLRLAPSDDPAVDLQLAARNVLVVDRPRLATLWVSTPDPLRITGRFRAASVGGSVRVERGRVYIPELIDKRVVDLNEYRDVVDTATLRVRTLLPGAPAAFVENLTLADVRVSVGDDVWLRSAETNVKLGGSLAVTRAVAREAGRARPELALLGELQVERGTYRLDLLPLAQPTFDVQPGRLRFFGTPDLNPALDIRAVHTVRQNRPGTNRPDVNVQVAIGGTLSRPSLQLSSADTPPIPDTDLISYLVTGEPAAAIFGQAQASDQVAAATSIISRLAGSLVAGALSRGDGPFDVVQVQTGAVGSPYPGAARETNVFANILGSTRLGVGGRLGPRTFYTFSTGFCSFTGNADPSQSVFSNFTRGLGVRLEQQVTGTFSVQVGVEPALQQQACLAGGTTRFFQQTPSQGSIDITKRWSF